MRMLALLMLVSLTACTSVSYRKFADGSTEVNVNRVASDVAFSYNPETGLISYSSDAETAAAVDTNRQLIEALLARTAP